MKAQPFIDRLEGLGFIDVGGPIEWAGAKNLPRLPAAFFVPVNDTAGPNTLADAVGCVDQLVTYDFGINIVLQGAARITSRIDDKLNDTVAAVVGRFLGWSHPQAVRAASYLGGGLLAADGVQLTWAVRFRTAYRLRKVS